MCHDYPGLFTAGGAAHSHLIGMQPRQKGFFSAYSLQMLFISSCLNVSQGPSYASDEPNHVLEEHMNALKSCPCKVGCVTSAEH